MYTLQEPVELKDKWVTLIDTNAAELNVTWKTCLAGEVQVTVSAAAEQSQTGCGNEVVTVPERGRIDTVTRSLRVKVGVP